MISYIRANFGENRPRNATARDLCSQTDTLTDANRFYNLFHAICYGYGKDKKCTDYSDAISKTLQKHFTQSERCWYDDGAKSTKWLQKLDLYRNIVGRWSVRVEYERALADCECTVAQGWTLSGQDGKCRVRRTKVAATFDVRPFDGEVRRRVPLRQRYARTHRRNLIRSGISDKDRWEVDWCALNASLEDDGAAASRIDYSLHLL